MHNAQLGGGGMKKDNVIVDKSKAFALRIINLYKYLCEEKHEYIQNS